MYNFGIIKNNEVIDIVYADSLEVAEFVTKSNCVQLPEDGSVSIGNGYNTNTKIFIKSNKPYDSWFISGDTNDWQAPKNLPDNKKTYKWDEEKQDWVENPIFPSWVWDEKKEKYSAPIKYPMDGKFYVWNEDLKNWEELIQEITPEYNKTKTD